jgi:hypothetical protein
MNDPIANHLLKALWHEIAGVYVPGWFRSSYQIGFRPGQIIARSGDGHLVEITARRLEPADPSALKFLAGRMVVADPDQAG